MSATINPYEVGQGREKQDYSQEESMRPGHFACPGCGGALAMRQALKVLGTDMVVVIPACCWAVIPGPFPYTNLKTPLMHTAFETTGAVLSGVRAALDMRGKKDTLVMGWAGDGGTFDIGFQAMSAAAERNENVLYVCYDNEAYMNTGIQRSSATPEFTWTTTTPTEHPKKGAKKDVDFIVADHNPAYMATTSPAYPHDLMAKFKKAKSIKGFKFIHIFAACTPGWKIPSEMAIEVMRMATETRAFPLFEIEDGKWKFTYTPEKKPVADYLKVQGRFKHMTDEQIAKTQEWVDERFEKISRMMKF